MIELKNVCIGYGARRVVEDLSFSVDQGSVFGLIGLNGAGKSTTLGCVVGLLRPSQGEIWVAGVNMLKDPDEARLRVGYVPQQLALFSGLTVRENLEIFGGLYHIPSPLRKRRIEEALVVAQLQDKTRDRIEHLSGGMQRRLNLACALLHDPEVIVCDEPTVGVDPKSRAYLIETLRGFGTSGKAVLYTAHHMDEVEDLCTHVGMMDKGRLLATGTTQAILGQSAPEGRFEVEFSQPVSQEALEAALAPFGAQIKPATPRLEAVFMRLVSRRDKHP